MKKTSFMSRAELVCELIAPPPSASASDAPATYIAADDASASAAREALVARKLAVAKEILLHDLMLSMKAGPVMDAPDAARHWLTMRYAHLEHELFIVLHLDVRNRLIRAEEMFRGTLTHTSVYPREVVKSALAHNAASVMLPPVSNCCETTSSR
ncbi:DNA repair protein RadC [Oxalobacteraceae bacterium GrIS 1.11]